MRVSIADGAIACNCIVLAGENEGKELRVLWCGVVGVRARGMHGNYGGYGRITGMGDG